jgi:hypothetical protein
MYDREQVRNQFKQETKDAIFLAKFEEEVNQELQRVQNAKKYSERVDRDDYISNPPLVFQRFKVEGDDAQQTKKWEALMTDCAFYYDKPTTH